MSFKLNNPDDWLNDILQGLEYRSRFGLEETWGMMESIYYNVHPTMANDGANIFLSQGDSMLSSITVPDPVISIEPRTESAVDKAPIVESVDNFLIEETGLSEEVQHAALCAYLFGVGFLKYGYDSAWGYEPSYGIGAPFDTSMTLTQMSRDTKRLIEFNEKVRPGMPWVQAVLPHDIVVPWGTYSIESAPWIAHRVVRHIEDLRSDVKYTGTRDLQPTLSVEDFVNSYLSKITLRAGGNTRKAEYVELWEIHDKRVGMVYTVATNHRKFLRKNENLLQIENRLPFAAISFTPRVRSIWTTPDSYYLFHIQNELSDVAVQRTKQRRLATLKFLYDGDSISDEELETMLSPDVGAAAKVRPGRKLNEAITRLDNQVNQTLGIEEEHLRQNAREQIGFSQNQVGTFVGGRRTAREVGIVDRASQLRMSRRGLAVRKIYRDSMTTFNNLVFSFWTLPRVLEVLGEDGTRRWQEVRGVSLKDKFHYKVDLINKAEQRQQRLEALQLYGLLSQDPTIDPVALRNYLSEQINDPGFRRLFNARIQLAMSALRQSGGVLQPQNNTQGRAASQMQSRGLQGQNGSGSLSTVAGQLAGRGLNP